MMQTLRRPAATILALAAALSLLSGCERRPTDPNAPTTGPTTPSTSPTTPGMPASSPGSGPTSG
jgi:hypothetical protein